MEIVVFGGVAIVVLTIVGIPLYLLIREMNSTVYQVPGFDHGDMVRLKINPEIRGMIKDSVGCSPRFSEAWGYNVRLENGEMLSNVREFEMERAP